MPTLDKVTIRSPVLDLPEPVWREIEATLGLEKPNPGVRERIARYVANHLFDATIPEPRRALMRHWIERIQKHGKPLLADLDWSAREDETDDAWAQTMVIYDLLSGREQEQVRALLKKLTDHAENLLARVRPDKGGKVADAFAYGLVYDLATAYELATGKRPTCTYNPYGDRGVYESPFLNFVDAVLRHVAPDHTKGNLALGKLIQRVLKIWRRHRGLKD